jgi:hypothetical protein
MSDTRREAKKLVLPGDLVANATQLLKGFEGSRRESLYSIWIQQNIESIKAVTLPGQNWFIPTQLGGLGLPLPGEAIRITRGQGKMASFLMHCKEKMQLPRLEIFRPTYLRMEDFHLRRLRKSVKYEWTEEEREDPFPTLTKYYESQHGCDLIKSLPEEEAGELARVSREWDSFWTTTTNSRLEPMDDAQVRGFHSKKFLPEARYTIGSSTLRSTIFD